MASRSPPFCYSLFRFSVGFATCEALTALRAIACHSYLGIGNIETLLTAYIVFHLLAQWTLKLYDFTAAKADQVVMLSRGLYLIAVMRLIKVKFL